MREGWKPEALGSVCQIKPPKKEAKQKLADSDLVSFVPMNDLGQRQKALALNEERPLNKVVGSYTYFADNDVLLAKITPCFENGKLGIARNLTNGVGFGSSEYIVFRSTGDIDPEYLFYFLSQDSFRDAGARVMTGAVGHKRVPKEFIENYPIPVPPLSEQKRIVAILDEAFEGIGQAIKNAEKNLTNACELFESYLNSVFIQKGEGWVETKLGDEISLLTGFAFKSKGYTKSDDGIPLLRGDNIVQGTFRWENVKKWPENDAATYDKYFLEDDDVVLAMDRTWVNAGLKYAQISSEDLPCLLLQRVARLRAAGRLEHTYLKHLIGSVEFTRYVLSIQTGLGVPHISGKQISDFRFSLPPLEMQRVIAIKLDEISSQSKRLETIYQQKLASLTELKQSLLQKAFAGELTAESDIVLKEEVAA